MEYQSRILPTENSKQCVFNCAVFLFLFRMADVRHDTTGSLNIVVALMVIVFIAAIGLYALASQQISTRSSFGSVSVSQVR